MYRKKDKNNPQNHDIKTNMVETLHLPKDYVLGSAIVTIMGNCELLIENYKGILEYTSEVLIVQTKTCQIHVRGDNLLINYYTNEEMKITGCIRELQYLAE